jgi:hypothetical protein
MALFGSMRRRPLVHVDDKLQGLDGRPAIGAPIGLCLRGKPQDFPGSWTMPPKCQMVRGLASCITCNVHRGPLVLCRNCSARTMQQKGRRKHVHNSREGMWDVPVIRLAGVMDWEVVDDDGQRRARPDLAISTYQRHYPPSRSVL